LAESQDDVVMLTFRNEQRNSTLTSKALTSTDPLTYTLVACAVMTTAILATWQPARRAARVDPAVALRAE
jgi:ABC-type lipoprotein release transport system permease subunit